MTQNPQFQPAVNNAQSSSVEFPQGIYAWELSLRMQPGLMGNVTTASTGGGAQYYAWDPNMRPAVIQQFNLNVQYQIGNHTSVQAGYVGQTGQHLAVPLWINQYTTDDTCAGLGAGAAQDACYQTIEPFYALVGNPNSG